MAIRNTPAGARRHGGPEWPSWTADEDRRQAAETAPFESPSRFKRHGQSRRAKLVLDLGGGITVTVEGNFTGLKAVDESLGKALDCIREARGSGATLRMLRELGDHRQDVEGFGGMNTSPFQLE